MKSLLLTLYQNDYHLGAAAMVNSALRQGFRGRIILGHDGSGLPSWTSQLQRIDDTTFRIEQVELSFRLLQSPRHFGYHKPFAMQEMLVAYPDWDQVIYADPDILFLAPWKFFQDWAALGVAYCLDSQFPHLPSTHPWREEWRSLIATTGYKVSRSPSCYPNSGFLAVSTFFLEERHRSIVGDQDLMAAALMAWDGAESIVGPEGMGFTNYFYLMVHDIARPKAWKRDFLREAFAGVKPTKASALFLDHCQGPIQVLPDLGKRRFFYKTAQTISRVWKR